MKAPSTRSPTNPDKWLFCLDSVLGWWGQQWKSYVHASADPLICCYSKLKNKMRSNILCLVCFSRKLQNAWAASCDDDDDDAVLWRWHCESGDDEDDDADRDAAAFAAKDAGYNDDAVLATYGSRMKRNPDKRLYIILGSAVGDSASDDADDAMRGTSASGKRRNPDKRLWCLVSAVGEDAYDDAPIFLHRCIPFVLSSPAFVHPPGTQVFLWIYYNPFNPNKPKVLPIGYNIYTWNPNDLCFFVGVFRPCFGGLGCP